MKLTVHLSAESHKAIRPNDGVSPRINQIIERYQAIIAAAQNGDRSAIVKAVLEAAAKEDAEAAR